MSEYDWSAVVQALIGLAAGTITLLSAFALRCLREWLEASRVARVVRAARNGAALALAHAEAAGFGEDIRQVEEAGMKLAVSYMHGGTVGRIIASIGYTPAHLEEMLRSQLAQLRNERGAVPLGMQASPGAGLAFVR